MDFLHIFRDSWKWTTKETLQNWSLPKHQAQWSRSLHILVSLYDVRFSSKQMFGWIWSIHSYHMFLVFIVVIVVILPFIFGLQKVCQRCSVGRALLAEGISGRFEAKISVANLRERDWFDWLGRLRCLRRKRCRGGRSWRRWSGNFKMRRRRFKCSSFDFRSVESDLMTPILSWKTFVSFKWTSLVSNLSSLVLSSVFIWTLFNCKFLRPEAPGKAINFQKRGTVVLCNIVWHCAVICFFMAKTKGLELQNQISQASEQIALQLRHLRINFLLSLSGFTTSATASNSGEGMDASNASNASSIASIASIGLSVILRFMVDPSMDLEFKMIHRSTDSTDSLEVQHHFSLVKVDHEFMWSTKKWRENFVLNQAQRTGFSIFLFLDDPIDMGCWRDYIYTVYFIFTSNPSWMNFKLRRIFFPHSGMYLHRDERCQSYPFVQIIQNLPLLLTYCRMHLLCFNLHSLNLDDRNLISWLNCDSKKWYVNEYTLI